MFYVSIIDGKRVSLALGPFKNHEDAKRAVPRVKDYVQEHYTWAAFWAFGTSRWTGEDVPPRGKLNGLGLSEGCFR